MLNSHQAKISLPVFVIVHHFSENLNNICPNAIHTAEGKVYGRRKVHQAYTQGLNSIFALLPSVGHPQRLTTDLGLQYICKRNTLYK